MTILMGAWAKHPFAMATGLGVNAFIAVTVATNPGLTWPDVMGLVIISGVTMLVLVLTGFRTAVFNAVPASLKTAIVVGIGMFIALIGLVNAGFVRRIPDAAGTTVPVGLGFDGDADRLAHPGVHLRPAADHRPGGAQDQGRHPDRHRGLRGAGQHPRGRLQDRPVLRRRHRTANPQGWSLVAPSMPDLGAARTCP